MLKSTFSHLQGVSRKKERNLWSKGITGWSAYKRRLGEQFTIFGAGETQHELSESEEAYHTGDIGFFRTALDRSDYYRLALEYPFEVMFLDIETTGLSLYYDQITIIGWSFSNRYGVFIFGDDESAFLKELKRAKVIVTFNGTLFDLKFIKKYFEGVEFPGAHLDLRYFSKRVGLTGGQKAIERELGVMREDTIEDMLGEAAPILWHKYRRGDNRSLKRLIEYNHADVEGMKAILDESIRRYYEKEDIPSEIRIAPRFQENKSRIIWARKLAEIDPYKVFLVPFKGSVKPLITYKDLNIINSIDNLCVIGIDLVSSEDRESGYCVLKGDYAETTRLKTDEDMISWAFEAGADIISIDSPLSIPRGRTSYFDDDPKRDLGITRLCERQMKKRGINSYPALIPSMQKLTKRGVELALKFRKMGMPVIESYPGAAQDVMSIPRKQAGLKYLTDGIAEFGIRGDYVREAVSHDELDAITSAIVGQFFWTGMYEALGDEVEDYLIIPDLHANVSTWLSKSVFILSGEISAGKTTAAEHLEIRGYSSTRYSKVLENILDERRKPVTRSNLQRVGREVNEDQGQRWLGNKTLSLVSDATKIVVDGIRFYEDVAFLREQFGPGCIHVHIDATEAVRTKRMIKDTAKEDLKFAVAKRSKTETEIGKLSSVADIVIKNNRTKKAFFQQLDTILGEM